MSKAIERLPLSNGRSAYDEKLLANARKSINELAEIVGLPGEVVAERLAILLEDRGWMSERQEERYMLIELGDLIEDSRQRLKRASDEDYAGIAKIVLGAMQQMAQRWDTRKKLVEEDIEQITAANARTFGRAYDLALSHVVNGLRELHPEITDTEVTVLSKEGLAVAGKMLQEKVKE